MPRIDVIDPKSAQPEAREMLDGVRAKLGRVPNLLATMAHSPAVLGAYLGLGNALSKGTLDAKLRESIALTVAGLNGCDYCASAHKAIGTMLGLADEELLQNLRGESGDGRTAAALAFASRVVEERGWVGDADLAAVRAAGFSDGEALEIVAAVVANILTNYVNHVAGTDIDFPRVASRAKAA